MYETIQIKYADIAELIAEFRYSLHSADGKVVRQIVRQRSLVIHGPLPQFYALLEQSGFNEFHLEFYMERTWNFRRDLKPDDNLFLNEDGKMLAEWAG